MRRFNQISSASTIKVNVITKVDCSWRTSCNKSGLSSNAVHLIHHTNGTSYGNAKFEAVYSASVHNSMTLEKVRGKFLI